VELDDDTVAVLLDTLADGRTGYAFAPTAVDATPSFWSDGSDILRLPADDGDLTASDQRPRCSSTPA
jgi:hypothetical protein